MGKVLNIIGGSLLAITLLTGCNGEREALRERIQADMKKTRRGEITYMAINPDKEQFGKWNGIFSYSNPSEVEELDYIMKIDFPEKNKKQIFKVIECTYGPDIGHPSQVFANFDSGDSVDVRISNGYNTDSSGTDVYRYKGTTHLDKGHVDMWSNEFSPTEYQVKCAGAFRTPKE